MFTVPNYTKIINTNTETYLYIRRFTLVELVEFETKALEAQDAEMPPRIETAARMFEGFPDLMTPGDVAEALGLKTQTIRYYIQDGRVPGKKIGQRYYIPKIALAEMVLDGVQF